MIPVLVITEQEGLARVYLRNGNGALVQAAQVLVGPASPTELATIAADLNEAFAWPKLVKPQAPPEKPKEVTPPPKKKRAPSPDRLRRSRQAVAAFNTQVLQVIKDNQQVSIAEIAKAIFGEQTAQNDGNVRTAVERLIKSGAKLRRTGRGTSFDPYKYSIDSGVGVDLGQVDGEVLT